MLSKDEGPEVQGRETWMTELPPEMTKNFGLGPRTFRKGAGRDPDADRFGLDIDSLQRNKSSCHCPAYKIRYYLLPALN